MGWRTKMCVPHLVCCVAFLVVISSVGCQRQGATSKGEDSPQVITARFTDPVDIEPQNSTKCIACHTKTNPITKLASAPAPAAAAAGG